MSEINEEYDVVIIGAGAGGGVAAGVLAEAGKRVLLLERGNHLRYEDVSRDHVRNHRLGLYGFNTGPTEQGNPRVKVEDDGSRHVVPPHDWRYSHNAAAVGGGTLVYGAQAWRFLPQDFRMAEIYGVPKGSSLSDWPISYDDLEPYYDRAEWEIGVSGQANDHLPGRKRGFPMPPMPDSIQRTILAAGAKSLGWNHFPTPLLINSVNYNNRPPCVRCGNCVGMACPSDSKNGTQNTLIPRALATGNCTLVPQAMASRINTDPSGKVVGVTFFSNCDTAPVEKSVRAKVVICSGGAIESARLLLNSVSDKHPHGLGNHSDQVGRHLQGHYYPDARARFKNIVYDPQGPWPVISTTQFNHGNSGIIGGAMLSNEYIKTPIIYFSNGRPPDAPNWGIAGKRFMRENYGRTIQVCGPVQEIPTDYARVRVDPFVKDKWGIPVAQLSGATHEETVRVAQYMCGRAEEWLRASGAVQVWGKFSGVYLSGGQHQAGTCRMGNDPGKSVTDSFGRVHGHENLFVADGSLHVTNGGFNPVLTILALGYRVAEHIAKMS